MNPGLDAEKAKREQREAARLERRRVEQARIRSLGPGELAPELLQRAQLIRQHSNPSHSTAVMLERAAELLLMAEERVR